MLSLCVTRPEPGFAGKYRLKLENGLSLYPPAFAAPLSLRFFLRARTGMRVEMDNPPLFSPYRIISCPSSGGTTGFSPSNSFLMHQTDLRSLRRDAPRPIMRSLKSASPISEGEPPLHLRDIFSVLSLLALHRHSKTSS